MGYNGEVEDVVEGMKQVYRAAAKDALVLYKSEVERCGLARERRMEKMEEERKKRKLLARRKSGRVSVAGGAAAATGVATGTGDGMAVEANFNGSLLKQRGDSFNGGNKQSMDTKHSTNETSDQHSSVGGEKMKKMIKTESELNSNHISDVIIDSSKRHRTNTSIVDTTTGSVGGDEEEEEEEEEVIRCVCNIYKDEGLMVQCEKCEVID